MSETPATLSFPPGLQVPMTLGQVLDRTFRLIRAHFRLLAGLALVPAAAMLLVFAAVGGALFIATLPVIQNHPTAPSPLQIAWAASGFALGEFLYVGIFVLYLAAAGHAVTQLDRGLPVTSSEAWSAAWSRRGRYLWLAVLSALYVVLPAMLSMGLVVAGSILLRASAAETAGQALAYFLIPLGVLLYLVTLVYSILMMLRFSLAFPACIVEGLTARQALARSTTLTSGARGRIFLVILIVYAFSYVINMIGVALVMALAAVGALLASLAHVDPTAPAFPVLVGLAVVAYLAVILAGIVVSCLGFTTALAVLYSDQRLRKDGSPPLAIPGDSPA